MTESTSNGSGNRIERYYDILQVWIEDPDAPIDSIKGWMQKLIDQVSDNKTYTLISKNNYFPKDSRVKWVALSSVEFDLLADYSDLAEFYNKLHVQAKSELIRYYWATKNKNTIYFDCDIEIKSFPKIPGSDKPFFIKRTKTGRIIDNFIFYVNKKNEFMERLLTEVVENMKILNDVGDKVKYGTTYYVTNRFSHENKISKLDRDFLTHHTEV